MKNLYRTMVPAALAVAVATPSLAGENAGAKILLHIGGVTTKNVCSLVPADCRDGVVSATSGGLYHLYVCVGDHSDSVGVAGAQFGITYNDASGQGVDVFSWTLCADLEFPMSSPSWPLSDGGNLVTWNGDSNCQFGPATTAVGYFYIGVYSPDRLSLTPRPADGRAKVADCAAAEDDLTDFAPSRLGYADFGTGDGYNPCQNVVPVSETTWSSVKSLFR